MRITTVRDLRSNLSSVIGGTDPVLVTRHGKPAAVVVPAELLAEHLTPELRRLLILVIGEALAQQLAGAGGSTDDALDVLDAARATHKGSR